MKLTITQKIFACIFILSLGTIAIVMPLHLIQFAGLVMIASILIYLVKFVKSLAILIVASLILIIVAIIALNYISSSLKEEHPAKNKYDRLMEIYK